VITWIEVMVGTAPSVEADTRDFVDEFDLIELDERVAEQAVALRRAPRIKLPNAVRLGLRTGPRHAAHHPQQRISRTTSPASRCCTGSRPESPGRTWTVPLYQQQVAHPNEDPLGEFAKAKLPTRKEHLIVFIRRVPAWHKKLAT
jgi:hypothetical protein